MPASAPKRRLLRAPYNLFLFQEDVARRYQFTAVRARRHHPFRRRVPTHPCRPSVPARYVWRVPTTRVQNQPVTASESTLSSMRALYLSSSMSFSSTFAAPNAAVVVTSSSNLLNAPPPVVRCCSARNSTLGTRQNFMFGKRTYGTSSVHLATNFTARTRCCARYR